MGETNIKYKKDSQIYSIIIFKFQIWDTKKSALESYIHKKSIVNALERQDIYIVKKEKNIYIV